jgi:hypothetical protein
MSGKYIEWRVERELRKKGERKKSSQLVLCFFIILEAIPQHGRLLPSLIRKQGGGKRYTTEFDGSESVKKSSGKKSQA